MALRLDFTVKGIIKEPNTVKKHTFMDIGSSNYDLVLNPNTNKLTVIDTNTTNFDKAAIKSSLRNILNFRTR